MLNKLFLTPVLLLSTLPLTAQAHWYIGGSVGQAQFSDTYVEAQALGYSTTQHLSLQEDDSMAVSIYGGYQFNPYFGLEASLAGIDALNGSYASIGDMSYLALQPKISYPVTDNFSVYAKAGIAYFNAEVKVSNQFAGASSYSTFSESDVSGILGLGVDYAVTDNVTIRASWDYLRPELDLIDNGLAKVTVDSDINIFSLGLSYHFL